MQNAPVDPNASYEAHLARPTLDVRVLCRSRDGNDAPPRQVGTYAGSQSAREARGFMGSSLLRRRCSVTAGAAPDLRLQDFADDQAQTGDRGRRASCRAGLPRSYEVVVHGRLKFRVGQIVWLAFSHDQTVMGFSFPKELRQALVDSDPDEVLPAGRVEHAVQLGQRANGCDQPGRDARARRRRLVDRCAEVRYRGVRGRAPRLRPLWRLARCADGCARRGARRSARATPGARPTTPAPSPPDRQGARGWGRSRRSPLLARSRCACAASCDAARPSALPARAAAGASEARRR